MCSVVNHIQRRDTHMPSSSSRPVLLLTLAVAAVAVAGTHRHICCMCTAVAVRTFVASAVPHVVQTRG